ncbi:MAG: hypothetical protein FH751_01765 [Firmicutes bacterium]|nr:hypothetical protein [Bacillota bacterium]
MSLLNDLFYTNKKTFNKTFNLFKNNWLIIFTGLLYTTLNLLLYGFVGLIARSILGILSGIVLFIATSAMISSYLYLLDNILRRGKFDLDDLKEGFKIYLWKIYGVFFIGWIAKLFASLLLRPMATSYVISGLFSTIITVLILILLNPLPEAIYQKIYSPWETILYTFDFIKNNWIEWFIPNVIFMGILYLTTGEYLLDIFTINLSFNFDLSIKGIALYAIGQILFSFIMIYRGVLFKTLSTSTRRKRNFMRNMYK